MNKQALFQQAHATARQTAAIVGDYLVAFKIALKQAWAEAARTVRTFCLAQKGVAKNGAAFVEMFARDVAAIGETLACEVEITEGRRANRRTVGKRIFQLTVTGLGKVFNCEGSQRVRCYGELTTTEVRF